MKETLKHIICFIGRHFDAITAIIFIPMLTVFVIVMVKHTLQILKQRHERKKNNQGKK